MKSILILMLLVASVAPACAKNAQQITAGSDVGTEPDFIFIQEIGMWKALQSHNLGAFESLLLPDYIEVERTIQRARIAARTVRSRAREIFWVRIIGFILSGT